MIRLAAVAESWSNIVIKTSTVHTPRLRIPIRAKKYRWFVAIALGGVTGILPFAVSGVLEFFAMGVLPISLGFLIYKWWCDRWKCLALALVLPLFGLVLRLASNSLLDGINWSVRIFGAGIDSAFGNPYSRQILIELLFPVLVTIAATAMFLAFWKEDAEGN